eukprot:NODE_1953_length_525_cov_945.617647_g1590_i0.p1 GENE.NODE_1953_length_525_cov_945.617647_g1590_i0~~NODE_1953_length_525_cov_945.617647_g1590_i0.p1  ORF type:complete len:133 (+),score=14.13 NODE_1953_length_525_cov_945.617647_g1590_i0:33-431(+)
MGGFDRMFFIGKPDDETLRAYNIAREGQAAALAAIRPGVKCSEVHAASQAVYSKYDLGQAYRTGRGVGFSLLEEPQFMAGNETVLRKGMVFAVDGAVTLEGRTGGRVGDTIEVTDDGFAYITKFPYEPLIEL